MLNETKNEYGSHCFELRSALRWSALTTVVQCILGRSLEKLTTAKEFNGIANAEGIC